MAKKISELTELATAAADNDVLVLIDTSAGTTKKITVSNLLNSPDVIDTNALVDDSVTPAKMLGIDLFGLTAEQSGTAAPAAGIGQFYIQAGSTVGTFASNALDITFPTAFPNGLLTVVTQNGNSVGADPITVGNGSTTKTGFRAQCASNGSQRVNWIAIGF